MIYFENKMGFVSGKNKSKHRTSVEVSIWSKLSDSNNEKTI
jgi:hypothetical protein